MFIRIHVIPPSSSPSVLNSLYLWVFCKLWSISTVWRVVHSSSPRNDEQSTSPCNIGTLFSKLVTRKKDFINFRVSYRYNKRFTRFTEKCASRQCFASAAAQAVLEFCMSRRLIDKWSRGAQGTSPFIARPRV